MEGAQSATSAGEIAGRYTLDRKIGRGGTGAVWVGTDRVLGRTVALKRLGLAPGAATPDGIRAEREARLAARLQHPHVVAVFDVADDRDEQWLVMEYVDGQTLADLVRSSGPLSPDRAAEILRQAADGLAAAHAAGIVHRDVKPSNILLTRDGLAKISDFGIARGEADHSLTSTNLVTGSPAYLAPEVASGATATPASDSWALGATAYHALTGHPPYDVGENVMGALYRIVHEEPPRVGAPGWLGPLLEHTMDRNPSRRWSMAQVRDYLLAGPDGGLVVAEPLEPARDGTQELAVVPPPRRPRSWVGPLVGAAVAVLLAGTVVLGAWLLGLFDSSTSDSASGPGGASATAASDGTTSPSPSDTAGEQAERAAAMETFVRDYLATVTRDPAEAWTMLTPEFQTVSGGFEKYRAFWEPVESATVRRISADPDAMTVTYRVVYRSSQGQGSQEPWIDEPTLLLQADGGGFLIAGES